MDGIGKYTSTSPARKIAGISTIVQYGKTQIPRNVRKHLGIKDLNIKKDNGLELVWYLEGGRVYVKVNKEEIQP